MLTTEDEREVLLSMLSDYNHAATYDRASAQRSADSCQWFTELDKLKDWMTDDWSSALWLHGIRENF